MQQKLKVMFAYMMMMITTPLVTLSTDCPHQCRCDSLRKRVYCMNKELVKLPLGIPSDTTTLYLQNNRLVNSPDLDIILSSLQFLTNLDLSNNSLTSFPKNLPESLTWISMKDNDIKYIGSQSLGGLTSLMTLNLDNNSITNKGLSSSAFSGAETLGTLSLKWNRLTSFPFGLPRRLEFAHFSHNLINSVPLSATADLSNLFSLDLSNNMLTSNSLNGYTLHPLIKLDYLDLSHNKFAYVPEGLPGNVTQLILSHNRIKSINAPAYLKNRDRSMKEMTFLEHLDLSFNRLRSVEPKSFDTLISLKTVILHENPWQCDCHLKYLNSWLSQTRALMTMESQTKCFTPDAFQGVTLRSLDHVSLICSSKQVPEYNISISPGTFTLSWLISNSGYPNYVEYKAFCGEPKCGNCSKSEIIARAIKEDYTYVNSIVNTYIVDNIVNTDLEKDVARVDITGRKPGKLYIVCLMESHRDITELTLDDCAFVKSEKTSIVSPELESHSEVPVWLAILIAFLAILGLATIFLVIYCQRLNVRKNKWKREYRAPVSQQMTYDPFRDIYTMPGLRTISATNSHHEEVYNEPAILNESRSATQDAGKEFNVTFTNTSNVNHNVLHVPSPETCESYCSDVHDDTVSTSHTRTNTINGSMSSNSDSGNHHQSNRLFQPQQTLQYDDYIASSNEYVST